MGHSLVATTALLLLVSACPAQAGELVLLDAADRNQYKAVGRLNTAGYAYSRGCSGTLIAPDLVVTAAHCVGTLRGADPRHHYVAGWYRGKFAAHRESASVDVHPLYELTEEKHRFVYDVAVVRLEDPVPRGLVAPIPLVSPSFAIGPSARLFGYNNRRPHALSGAGNCPTLAKEERAYLFGCTVFSGTSGGAALVDGRDGPALAAVIVGRAGADGHALAVPVSTWLWQIWREAEDRADRRY